MNGVQWIKITTDIFDDEKIQLIESMPEGDTLIVIWFKILVLAGKQNNSGILSLGNKVYYTEEMLSTVFRRKATSVKLALSMIERIPEDATSPLAYLFKSMENLKQERMLECKAIAHENARKKYMINE